MKIWQGLIAGILVGVVIFLIPAVWAAELSPYHARYDVTRGNSHYGEAVRTLSYTDGRYELYTETEITWLFLSDRRRYWSEFQFNNQLIDSLRFRYKRSGTGASKEFNGHFSWAEKQLINLANERAMNVDINQYRVDTAASLEQLRYDLQQGKESFRYLVIDEKGQPDELVYQRHGLEELVLPYGTVSAIKVSRVRENSKRETDYWFAPELGFVLVKMQQRENAKEVATLLLVGVD